MKLILKKFTCINATDDPGGDSPYFVVFVGKPKSERPRLAHFEGTAASADGV